ncbi:MAG: hypothetical protein NW207_12580 [Cytophagales bacterium]|nr:hypothetical protein [Cytophagales bacterium]
MQLAKELQDRTDAQLAKTEVQFARTDAKLWSIGVNIGQTAEEFFYYSLESTLKLGNLKFDYTSSNIGNRKKEIEDEFDIVMYNGDSVALIEIKHKVHPSDIEDLINRKVTNFRLLFPEYKDYKIYLGIGGMSVTKDIESKAKNEGIAVLRQKGEIAYIDANYLKVY